MREQGTGNREQELREKVVKGLECCGYSRFMDKCQECPYDGKDCFKRLKTDVIELLKPVKPRLVTREDFQQPPAYDGVLPCWKESRSKTRRSGWVAIVYGKALQDLEIGVARYWTGVPTEEQRREMDWPQK